MRTFERIRSDEGLAKFLDSANGTLYFVPRAPGSRRLIVRHFDGAVPADWIPDFVSLLAATRAFIDARPSLAELVHIAPPLEVGTDFVAREHFTYYTSTESYEDDDESIEPPDELETMRGLVRQAVEDDAGAIGEVLRRSLLEPTGKTWFNEAEGRFIVVDPVWDRTTLERWRAAGPAS